MITSIDRRSNLSRKELIEQYVEKGIPVVLTDEAVKWPGMGKITPDFFKNKYGHLVKEIKGKKYTVAEYVDLMLASTPENPAPYPCNLNVKDNFPELLAEITPDILYSKSDRVNHPLLPKFLLGSTEVYEFFLGGNGTSFPYLHVDVLFLHTQITQLWGSKEFFLYPPDQSAYMYPRADNPKASQVNPFKPDYEKFPLFKKAKSLTITVQQGETILFPTGWWHTTQIHEPCISLGRVQLNASNWDAFINDNYDLWKYFHPNVAKLAGPVRLYGRALGKLMNLQEKFMA